MVCNNWLYLRWALHTLILSDLTTRITAKELAERFGVSESSFKFYVKGILGDSYLNYFRKKRMEKAAELLETTNLKVIEIASAVGYLYLAKSYLYYFVVFKKCQSIKRDSIHSSDQIIIHSFRNQHSLQTYPEEQLASDRSD